MPITIAIEGPAADRAVGDFFSIPGIQGKAQPVEEAEAVRDGGVLLVIGTVVGIVGGIASIVDSIIEWREKWQEAQKAKQLSIIIEDAKGNRLLLDRATPEQIAAVLQTLSA